MPAVAMLGSRKGKERAAGACASALIANDDVGVSSNCKLVEFQEAVVATGERRHPAARAGGTLLLRVLLRSWWQCSRRTILRTFCDCIWPAGGIPPLLTLLKRLALRRVLLAPFATWP
jgi:hypothetical protein